MHAKPTSDELKQELAENIDNENVGHTLLFENDKVKVWQISLAPGERIHYHRHNHDYFWTVLQDGVGLSNQEDGREVPLSFSKFQTSFYNILADGTTVHDLQNMGDKPLEFITVELKY